LHGPYFIVDEISDWRIQSGAAQLTLAGGSKWIISEREEKFRLVRDTIDLALRQKKPVFLSGDRNVGTIEWVTLPKRLRPMAIAREQQDGKLRVTFYMSPSVYYLRSDRPWYSTFRALIERVINEKKQTELSAELMVSIDTPTSELVDVRAPQ